MKSSVVRPSRTVIEYTRVTNGGEMRGMKRARLDIARKIVTFPKSEFLRILLSFPGVRISGISIDTSRDMPAESETENRKVQRFRNIIRETKSRLSYPFLFPRKFSRQSWGS